MSSAGRRVALRHGIAIAVGTVCAFNTQSVFAQGTRSVTPPQGPMLLTRKISRQLIDGKHLVVTRSWNITFAPLDTGWHVGGSQVGVAVSAPEGLEALARLERTRQVNEAFPLQLDSLGHIVRGAPAERQVGLEELAEAAKASISDLGGTSNDDRQLAAFLNQMQQASIATMTRFPQDLFFPENGELNESKLMDLPGGLTGRMDLTYRATANPDDGLLRESERSVITQIQGEALQSSELWTLETV